MGVIQSVTIFGSAIGEGGEHNFNQALLTGKLLAQSGYKVVDGGGPGVMFAAIEGAKLANGKTSTVYLEPDYATAIQGREKTISADEEYSEKNYIDRTKKLMDLGDAYVFFNGGTGTIRAYDVLGCRKTLFGFHKPLILVGDFWREVIETIVKNMKIRQDEVRVLKIVNTPEEVVSALEDFEELIQADRKIHIERPGEEAHLMLGYTDY